MKPCFTIFKDNRTKTMVGQSILMCFFCIICTNVSFAQDVEQQMSQEELQQLMEQLMFGIQTFQNFSKTDVEQQSSQQQQLEYQDLMVALEAAMSPHQEKQQLEQQQCKMRLDYNASMPLNVDQTRNYVMIARFFIHNRNETDIQSWRLSFTFTDNERIINQYDVFSKNVNMKAYRHIAEEFQNDVVLEWHSDNETNYIKKGGQAEVGWVGSKDLTENNVTMSAPSEVQFNNLQNCTLTRQFDKLLYGYVGQEDAQIQVNYSTVITLNNKNETVYTLPQLFSLKIRSITADVFNLKDLKLYYYFSGDSQSLQSIRAEDYLIECIDSDDQQQLLNCSKMTFNIQSNVSSMYSAQNVVQIGFLEGAGYLFDYNGSLQEQVYQVMENGLFVFPSISVQFRIRSLVPFGILNNTNDFSYKFSPIEFQQAYENFTVAKREYVPNEKIPVLLNGTQIAGISPKWQIYEDKINTDGYTDGVTECLNGTFCNIHVVYCCTDEEQLIGDFLTIPDGESVFPTPTQTYTASNPPSKNPNINISQIIIIVVSAVLLCCVVTYIIIRYRRHKQQKQLTLESSTNSINNNEGEQSPRDLPQQLEMPQIDRMSQIMETGLYPDSRPVNQDSLNSSDEQGQVEQTQLYLHEHNQNMTSLANSIHIPSHDEKITISSRSRDSAVNDIHSGVISGSLKDLQRESQILENKKFNQAQNWWAALRIPEGVREIPITDLKEVRPLGQGGFATVYEVELEDDVKEKYHDLCDQRLAVKIIYKEFAYVKDQMEAILKEVNVMKELNSQYVVQLVGASLHIRPSLVMELVPQGSLEKLLYNVGFQCHQTSLSWKLKLMLNISKGIQYLHSKEIVHRDLKPANILIKDAKEASIKISDFGISRIIQSSIHTKNCFAGTRQYLAPEVFQENITFKVDIWALGVIMQEIIRGVMPGKGQHEAQVLMRLYQHEAPDKGELPDKEYPQELCSLIRSCWFTADERPCANEIVNKLNVILEQLIDQNITD